MTKKKKVRSRREGPLVIVGDIGAVDLLRPRLMGKDTGSIRVPQTNTNRGAGFGDLVTDDDLAFAVLREPLGFRLTYMMADDIFDQWFKVDDPNTQTPDADLDAKTQSVFSFLNMKTHFINAAALERTYGYSLIVLGLDDVSETSQLRKAVKKDSYPEVKEISVYSKPEVMETETEKDVDSPRYGEPKIYKLRRGGQTGASMRELRVHYTRVIRVETRPGGTSVLLPIWDDLTNGRNIAWGMGQTMYRYGSGFPVITFPGKSVEKLQEYMEAGYFADLMSRSYMLINEKMTVEFKGMAGSALDPQRYVNPILERISAGSGMPEAIIRGAQAGALTGSEVNEREYFKIIGSLQSKHEPYVRDLVERIIKSGQIEGVNKETDFKIVWSAGFEATERDRAETDLMFEQGQQIRLQYMRVDEVRDRAGLEKLGGEEGQQVPGLVKAAPASPFGGMSAEDVDLGAIVRNVQHRHKPAIHEEKIRLLLNEILGGTVTREAGLAKARTIIAKVVHEERQRGRAFVFARTGKKALTLPPELERQYKKLEDEYLGDFESILIDAERTGTKAL